MTDLSAPIAPRRPHPITQHGQTRVDDYFWLRDRDDPAVTAYLEAENAYTAALMAPTRPLQAALYREMRGRIQEEDSTVPERRDAYDYYSRTEAGRQYPIYCRRRADGSGAADAPEEVLLDVNVLAEGRDFCEVALVAPSPDHRWLAYAVEFDGSEVYTLCLKDLVTGALLPERIGGVYANRYDHSGVEWANDSRTLFYSVLDHAHRSYQLYRHGRGADPAEDVLIYHEPDQSFSLGIRKTRDHAYLILLLQNNTTSEVRFAPADQPQAEFALVAPRRPGEEYFVAYQPAGPGLSGGRFLILTNDQATNFRLMEAPAATPGRENWREFLPHRDDVLLEGLDVFRDYLVIYERQAGLKRIRLSDPDGRHARLVPFQEPAYTIWPHANPDFNSQVLRFTYSSMVTPNTVVEYGLGDGSWVVRKQDAIPSGYDASQYQSERLTAVAPDGAQVPISIVYKKGRARDGRAPLLLYGYGAYGFSRDPAFDSNSLSLLDRGVAVAIAHVRGGSELGRAWYDDGKLLHKKNTFFDFIACAEHLIAAGYTRPDRLAALGVSAGGLLMGAITTLRPELFKCVVAKVPFVDVVNSMNDPSIPLTVVEWEEWGNPADRQFFDYLLSYSPYDNVQARDYPSLLVTAGLNDPRVAYWEPAKFVAKLRALKTDAHRLLLKTHMGAGHAGSSGRFDYLNEIAFEYAFILDTLGVT